MPDCPTCPRNFDTERGMKVHHAREHGESIAYKDYQCLNCGEEDTYHPSFEMGKFCNQKCRGEYYSGDRNPMKDPEIQKKNAESQRGRKLSEETKQKLKGPRPSLRGENNPNWTGGPPELICEWCGNLYEDEGYDPEVSRFCGDRCKYNWLSESMKGENHHRFNPDKEENYGLSWTESLRGRIRERDDYECQLCGIDQSELDWKLDVHHIIKFSEFGVENHEEANREENLISLCRYCHGSEEQNPTLSAD